jgi:XTP/dITP diphosphohydrolase
MKILIATRNAGKLEEINRLITPAGIEVVPLAQTNLVGDVPETGKTHLENAAAKALFWSRQYEGPVLAEDSGLEVEALDGGPGVYTARYGGPDLSDEKRYRKLLEELAAKPDAERTAAYRCVCALPLSSTRQDVRRAIAGGEGPCQSSRRGAARAGHVPQGTRLHHLRRRGGIRCRGRDALSPLL